MGRYFAVLQWQGGNDRSIVRRSHADASCDGTAAAPGGDRTRCDGPQLSRELDVPGRRFRTVVQSELDVSTRAEHPGAVDSREYECVSWSGDDTPGELPGV